MPPWIEKRVWIASLLLWGCTSTPEPPPSPLPTPPARVELSEKEEFEYFYERFRRRLLAWDEDYLRSSAIRPEGMLESIEKLSPIEQHYFRFDSSMRSLEEMRRHILKCSRSSYEIEELPVSPTRYSVKERCTGTVVNGRAFINTSTYLFDRSTDGSRWLLDTEQDHRWLEEIVSVPREPHVYILFIGYLSAWPLDESDPDNAKFEFSIHTDGVLDKQNLRPLLVETDNPGGSSEIINRYYPIIFPRLAEGDTHHVELRITGIETDSPINFFFSLHMLPPGYAKTNFEDIARDGELIFSEVDSPVHEEQMTWMGKRALVIPPPHTDSYTIRREFR